jgi:hypothetical protein
MMPMLRCTLVSHSKFWYQLSNAVLKSRDLKCNIEERVLNVLKGDVQAMPSPSMLSRAFLMRKSSSDVWSSSFSSPCGSSLGR